jgi:uncharacterized protein involved in oxidation of intracellular sulfur
VRFCNAALKKGHSVKLFLMSAGVEIENIRGGKYDIVLQLEEFSVNGGKVLACGTCMKSRNRPESDVCPTSTMNDCVEMAEWADKVVTF